jgi:hypothetical protein
MDIVRINNRFANFSNRAALAIARISKTNQG